MNIEMALKSRSYILDLDHVKLSLGILFFLSCLIESIFHQLSGPTFIFVKNTQQKTTRRLANLIRPVKLRKSCLQMVLPDVLECRKSDHIPSGPWASLGNCFEKCPFVH